MFTGIVQGKLPVLRCEQQPNLTTLVFAVEAPLKDGLAVGASVAFNGTCLTVRSINEHEVCFDVISQSLALTNLGDVQAGDYVNVERAAKFGDEIGGHGLSGHIMTTAELVEWQRDGHKVVMWLSLPESIRPFVLDKGYIALNGCSLTIAELEADRFAVHLIPETLDITTFGEADVGARINVEVDAQTQAVVETVRNVLSNPDMIAQLTQTAAVNT